MRGAGVILNMASAFVPRHDLSSKTDFTDGSNGIGFAAEPMLAGDDGMGFCGGWRGDNGRVVANGGLLLELRMEVDEFSKCSGRAHGGVVCGAEQREHGEISSGNPPVGNVVRGDVAGFFGQCCRQFAESDSETHVRAQSSDGKRGGRTFDGDLP